MSRSGYYAWRARKPSQRKLDDQKLLKRIRSVFKKSHGRYGSPKVYNALKARNINVGRKRVERLMREDQLVARVARIYRRKPLPQRSCDPVPNIRKDLPKPTAINQHWATDVTYIKLKGRWLYLAVVLDLYSRRVVGWSLKNNRTAALTKTALLMAIRNRRPPEGLIFHSDQGIEFRASELQNTHKRYGIKPSMNRAYHCTDNAEMESFFHTLKGELITGTTFRNVYHLRDSIAGYIQHFYNRARLHSSLNYQSPVEYEAAA
ncbi:IS3 family transposase [Parendozoicomonas haliclonae]|uniref:IS2 transposase TnpB n=1 Tax=Parendozoicomonas haliclonae TaxID=1960125 RepID=A0A1X7ARX6_9GAMM|nr:IS2 transposase TnpB [Parendozoicomonas haliclonae]